MSIRFSRLVLPLALALVVGTGARAVPQPPDEPQPWLIRVTIHDPANELSRLRDLQLDLAGVNVKEHQADFVCDASEFLSLLQDGFDARFVRSLAPLATDALSDYLSPTEVATKIDQYATTYPSLCKKVQISTTEEGRPVWALKISDNPLVEEDEPTIFYVGQHHAREVMTPEITMDIIDWLLTRYATDTQVKHWVDTNEIWVVPSHNPDGTNQVFTGATSWRKNHHNNGDGTFGVDPNRNYPFKWGTCNGSSGAPSSDTYRGPSPGSEPETQGWMQLARDNHPVINLSYHTYGELAIHPYGCTGVFTAENRFFRDHASDLATKLVGDTPANYYQPGTAWELLYDVDGEMNDWFYGELGSYGLTVEANTSTQGFQPDYATWRDSTVIRNRPGWQFLLDRMEGPGVSGHATNACTGAPLAATMTLTEVTYANGETPRLSEPGYGRYTFLTVPGTWHVNATLAGYSAQSWSADVGYAMATQEIRLVPAGSSGAEFVSFSVGDAGGDGDGQLDPGEDADLAATAKATGGALTNLTAVLSTTDPYVTILQPTATFGSVGAGGTALSSAPQPRVRISAQAPDGHVAALTWTFSATQSLCSPVSTGSARLTTGSPSCPAIQENLNANPLWTIQNSDPSGWAFGVPGGGGGTSGPNAAHSGSFVYGTNLTGNYVDSASYTLTTTPFNISQLRNVELRYWRWLNNEAGYDTARIEVSPDGSNWTEAWRGFGRDETWQLYRHDLSVITAGWSTLYVRFKLTSDVGTVASGWYLDDVSICGETKAPAPYFVITSWSLSDAGKASCSDHDAWADGGEIADLTVNLRNDGSQTAQGAAAFLASANTADIGLATVRANLGDVLPGGTGTAVFRFKVADAATCKEPAVLQVEASANGGAWAGLVGQVALTLEASSGTPVPDTTDAFETNAGWTLGNEWQIDRPRGRGGSTATGGAGTKDPNSSVSGTKVLGLDLTGLGLSSGNYENSAALPTYTATSPVYNCSNSTTVLVSFKRWLCVESSTADRATLEVSDGTGWHAVWSNPASDMSDTAWQSVSYDVSQWAAGKPSVRVRFTVTPNSGRAFCGWNVDDLVIGTGYTPVVCDTTSCSAGCKPTTEAANLRGARNAAGDLFTWNASTDSCRETSGGPTYRIYRSTDPVPLTQPVNSWPADTHFTDVSGRDADGSATNASFTEKEKPTDGQAFFYLVVVMGSNGQEGPVGAYGK
jgi:hypothetical protein